LITTPRCSGPWALVVALIITGSSCLLALSAGCGGGGGGNAGPSGLPSRFLYASAFQETSPGSGKFTGGIYAYQFDPSSGGITAVAGSPFATDTIGAPVALSGHGRFLYSINFATDGSIAAFSIQVDGSLARVPGAPFVTTEPTRSLVTNPAADFLFAIAYSGDLTVYTIDSSTGALTAQSTAGVAALGSPLVITPDGQRLYQISPSEIFEFSIDPATGALKPLAGSPVAIQTNTFGPGDTAIDPSGRFIYVTNFTVFTGFGGPMYAWSIDPQTGAVSPIPPFSPTAGPQASVAVDASGKYAIVTTVVTSKTGPNCFAVLGIDPTSGMLSQVPGSPFGGDCGVLVADSSGPYIYDGSSGVTVYSLDETTGIPQSVTGSALPGMVVSSLAVTH
jgi:lactonase family protein with 7-bladed beta-propeller